MHDGTGAFTLIAGPPDAGKRLDAFVADRISQCSRSFSAALIRDGKIRVQGEEKKPGYRLRPGEIITGAIPPPETVSHEPEPMALHVLYEDDALIVVNKPAGVVVHPAPGHPGGTLVNGLLHHCPELGAIGGVLRPGIVHRLDKDTSGALVVAKNSAAMAHLALQFKTRQVRKQYLALVHGTPTADSGAIDLPIGRHPKDRKKMSVHSRKSRTAETQWQVLSRFPCAALLRVTLKTGRTHQIRVHCASMGHPVMGDAVYGPRKRRMDRSLEPAYGKVLQSVHRQMLHAWRLAFTHPDSGETLETEAPLPEDMRRVVEALSG